MDKIIVLLSFLTILTILVLTLGIATIDLNTRIVEIERKLNSDMMMGKKLRW